MPCNSHPFFLDGVASLCVCPFLNIKIHVWWEFIVWLLTELPLRIAINEPSLGMEERRAVFSVLKNGQLTSASVAGGRHVQAFEKAAASYVGTKYAVAVSSGTAALQASLHALNIKRGDEVLMPSFTFVATANAVVSAGARPVFVDIIRDNYTVDPDDLAKKITKRTKAIIPVHLYGNVAPVDQIAEVAKKNNLPVIEDSAQSLGSKFRKRQTGTFFDLGCFSMYPSKVITAGEGGFVVTDDQELRDKLLAIRNHGIGPGGPHTFGLNMRLPEINAVIANVQMKKLPKFLKTRRRNAGHLARLISDLGIQLPEEPRDVRVNWYLYTVATSDRDKILRKLNRRGIGAAAYYATPVHKNPFYKRSVRLSVTDWASTHVMSLPVHPQVSIKDIEYIAKTMRDAQ